MTTVAGPATVNAMVRERAEELPAETAYVFLRSDGEEEERLTYADVWSRARGVAAALSERCAPGDPVLVLAPAGADFVVGLLGAMLRGAIAVSAYPPAAGGLARSLERIEATAAGAGARAVLTTERMRSAAEPELSELPTLASIPWLSAAASSAAGDGFAPAEADPGVPALIQYTSGSTGAPRRVVLSHRTLIHQSALIQASLGATRESRTVRWLPLYHDMGVFGGVLQPLSVG